eukprot:403359222
MSSIIHEQKVEEDQKQESQNQPLQPIKKLKIKKQNTKNKKESKNVTLNSTFDDLKKKIKLLGFNSKTNRHIRNQTTMDNSAINESTSQEQSLKRLRKKQVKQLKPIDMTSMNIQDDEVFNYRNNSQLNYFTSRNQANMDLKSEHQAQYFNPQLILFESKPLQEIKITSTLNTSTQKNKFYKSKRNQPQIDSLERLYSQEKDYEHDFEPIKDTMFNTAENFTGKRNKKGKLRIKKLKRNNQSLSQPKISKLPFQTVDFKQIQMQKLEARQKSQAELLEKNLNNTFRRQNLQKLDQKSQLNSSFQSLAQLSNKPSIILKAQILKPAPFKLKELSKYSQRLSYNDLRGRNFSTVLTSSRNKLLSNSNQKLKTKNSNDQQPYTSSQIIKKILQFDWFNSGICQEIQSGMGVQEILQQKFREGDSLLSETEVKYYKSQLKNQDKPMFKQLFQKSLSTLKYLFSRLLTPDYSKSIAQAFVKKHIQNNIQNENMALEQLLQQCELVYEINHLMRNIFRSIIKFKTYEESNQIDSLKTLGERLKNQINIAYSDIQIAFGGHKSIENTNQRFIYENKDLLEKLKTMSVL